MPPNLKHGVFVPPGFHVSNNCFSCFHTNAFSSSSGPISANKCFTTSFQSSQQAFSQLQQMLHMMQQSVAMVRIHSPRADSFQQSWYCSCCAWVFNSSRYNSCFSTYWWAGCTPSL